jgi:hypothetical protein
MKKVICLYGGPCSGKTTTAAGLFYHLKMMGYNCELNLEYVKNWIWEGREKEEGDQTYFFAKQSRKERVLMRNNLDFIITDSPLILTHFYGLQYDWMEQNFNTSEIMLKHHHEFCKKHGYTVEHFLLERSSEYNPTGRDQDEAEAKLFDIKIRELLDSKKIRYTKVSGEMVHQILGHLGLKAEKR